LEDEHAAMAIEAMAKNGTASRRVITMSFLNEESVALVDS